MYVSLVTAFMFVLPIASSIIEIATSNQGAFSTWILLKWFVFWAVGVRLLLAGLRQIFQPRYTAENILGISAEGAHVVVRELGFANTAIGCVAVSSIGSAGWVYPAGFAGAIFLGLAGISHLTHKVRNRNENVAMVSDMFVAIVLAVLLLPS